MEEWRQLEDCPGYLVNKDGRVWSEKLNKMLATKVQKGVTVCQFGPKHGKRWQVSIETTAKAYELGSIAAASEIMKQEYHKRAAHAQRPRQEAKYAETHAQIIPLWNEGLNAKQIQVKLGLGENTVTRHLHAAGIFPQKLVEERAAERAAQRRAAEEAERIAREAFRDLKGEQLELFPKVCQTCGRPMPNDSNRKYCCDECVPKYQGYDRNAVVCKDCGDTFSTDRHMGPKPKRCPTCEEKHKREVKRINRRYGKTLNARGRYWTRITGAAYEPINPDVVFERDDWTCYLCGCELSERDGDVRGNYPTVDHVTPLSGGGSHTYDNVRACCHTCNSYKGATMPEEVTCCA